MSVITEADEANLTDSKYDYGLDQLVRLDNNSEGPSFFHLDILGSTTNLTDGSAVTRQSILYDAWGNERDRIGESANKFTFTGHEKDGETGLIYAKTRFYESDAGRFITQDTYLGRLVTPPSMHRYVYAGQNPTLYVDPDGRDFISANEDGIVSWTVEEDGYLWNANKRVEQIGTVVEQGDVSLSEKYGGYVIKLEDLEGAADDFWSRYILKPGEPADISKESESAQNAIIKGYIHDVLITKEMERNTRNEMAEVFANWRPRDQKAAIWLADKWADGPEREQTVALLSHYVGDSGANFDLGRIPEDWQVWIENATGGKPGVYRGLSPYNGGPFSLRNGLGHFDVRVSTSSDGKTKYEISDIYAFPPDSKGDGSGQHGFPINGFSQETRDYINDLLPTRAYWNPGGPSGGYKEHFEIRQQNGEQVLIVPQQFLERIGVPFQVDGEFERPAAQQK